MKIDEIRRGERRKVSDAIPTDAEAVAELNGERIDVVNPVSNHGAERS
jgi:hypothetical protein